jgi:hypothetical protein
VGCRRNVETAAPPDSDTADLAEAFLSWERGQALPRGTALEVFARSKALGAAAVRELRGAVNRLRVERAVAQHERRRG